MWLALIKLNKQVKKMKLTLKRFCAIVTLMLSMSYWPMVTAQTSPELEVESALDRARIKRETERLRLVATRPAFGKDSSGNTLVEVFFATSRLHSESAKGLENRFGPDRSKQSSLNHGSAVVSFPKTHQIGGMERPGYVRDFAASMSFGLYAKEDRDSHVAIATLDRLQEPEFFKKVEMKAHTDASSSAMIFVHGFGVGFDDAVRRTAQIAHDLQFRGAPILYSWPSQGTVTPFAYQTDDQNVRWATDILANFLIKLLSQTQAENVHLIAHSMGTRALADALISAYKVSPEVRKKIAEVILAAPDYELESFRDQTGPKLAEIRLKITLYASSKDSALKVSENYINGFDRAGAIKGNPVFVAGIDSIDASAMDSTLIGHSYFSEARTLLTDLNSIIRDRKRPEERFGLHRIEREGNFFWRFLP
jgi:esterase/lipase superfamily enzyme